MRGNQPMNMEPLKILLRERPPMMFDRAPVTVMKIASMEVMYDTYVTHVLVIMCCIMSTFLFS